MILFTPSDENWHQYHSTAYLDKLVNSDWRDGSVTIHLIWFHGIGWIKDVQLYGLRRMPPPFDKFRQICEYGDLTCHWPRREDLQACAEAAEAEARALIDKNKMPLTEFYPFRSFGRPVAPTQDLPTEPQHY